MIKKKTNGIAKLPIKKAFLFSYIFLCLSSLQSCLKNDKYTYLVPPTQIMTATINNQPWAADNCSSSLGEGLSDTTFNIVGSQQNYTTYGLISLNFLHYHFAAGTYNLADTTTCTLQLATNNKIIWVKSGSVTITSASSDSSYVHGTFNFVTPDNNIVTNGSFRFFAPRK